MKSTGIMSPKGRSEEMERSPRGHGSERRAEEKELCRSRFGSDATLVGLHVKTKMCTGSLATKYFCQKSCFKNVLT